MSDDELEQPTAAATEPAPSPFVTRRTGTVTIKLARFEGPLDLLLHLVEQAKLDITTVSLMQVTSQYLAYMRAGEQIDHRALTNFLCSVQREPGLTPGDVLVSVTTLSFDIAALEIYLPLIVGARLVIVSRDVSAKVYRWSPGRAASPVTFALQPISRWRRSRMSHTFAVSPPPTLYTSPIGASRARIVASTQSLT